MIDSPLAETADQGAVIERLCRRAITIPDAKVTVDVERAVTTVRVSPPAARVQARPELALIGWRVIEIDDPGRLAILDWEADALAHRWHVLRRAHASLRASYPQSAHRAITLVDELADEHGALIWPTPDRSGSAENVIMTVVAELAMALHWPPRLRDAGQLHRRSDDPGIALSLRKVLAAETELEALCAMHLRVGETAARVALTCRTQLSNTAVREVAVLEGLGVLGQDRDPW